MSPTSRSGSVTPRGPVLDWSSFRGVPAQAIDSVESLPHKRYLTSGRAAIYHALAQLALPAGATVLVPSYHCVTMVAPVVLLRLEVAFYGIRADGLPNLSAIDAATARAGSAIIVPHYFGMPQSLAEVRQWCDANGIALIEDCAHSFFGRAGDRPVGAWGDFATASLSKFFPVPEAGLLASARRPVALAPLVAPGWKAQLKGVIDVLEHAAMHRRLWGLGTILRLLMRLKNARHRPAPALTSAPGESELDALMRESDMQRVQDRPLFVSRLLNALLPRGRIVARRKRNFARYAEHFKAYGHGTRPLFGRIADPIAAYVFPLWVDDADRVYLQLRAAGLPVFRWDRLWPGVEPMAGDCGAQWSRHVLQLLCHQDLRAGDIDRVAKTIKAALDSAAPQP